MYIYEDPEHASRAHCVDVGRALVGWALVGPHGPLWATPLCPPGALWAEPLWATPGPLRATPLWAPHEPL